MTVLAAQRFLVELHLLGGSASSGHEIRGLLFQGPLVLGKVGRIQHRKLPVGRLDNRAGCVD